MHRFQLRGIREYSRAVARRLLAAGETDRAKLGESVLAEVMRWVHPTDDPTVERARRASIGYGIAEALGLDLGPDPGESLPAPEWSIESERDHRPSS